MQAFKCAGRIKGGFGFNAEQRCRLHQQEGSQPFAAAQRTVPHCFEQVGRAHQFTGYSIGTKRLGEPVLYQYRTFTHCGFQCHK